MQKPPVSGESTPSSRSEVSLGESLSVELSEKEVDKRSLSQEITTGVTPSLCISTSANFNSEPNDQWNVEQHTELDDLSSDDFSMIQLYGKKIEQLHEVIRQRELVITQLSFRLETAIEAQGTIQKERDAQVEALVRDLDLHKQQLQQTKEIIAKQKTKNGISAQEFLDAQNKNVELEEQISQVTVDNELLKEKLEVFENRMIPSSEIKKGFEQSENEKVHELFGTSDKSTQVLLTNCEEKNIQTAVTCSTSVDAVIEIGVQTSPMDFSDSDFAANFNTRVDLSSIEKTLFDRYQSVIIERNQLKQALDHREKALASITGRHSPSESSESKMSWEQDIINESEQSLQKSLKRIICINNIAKTINYLLSGLNSFCGQTSQLANHSQGKCMSNEINELTHRTNDENSSFHQKNTLEVPGNSQISFLPNGSSIENFRSEELAENLSTLAEFLQQEMNSSCSQFNSSFNDSKPLELRKSDILSDESCNGIENNSSHFVQTEGSDPVFLHNLQVSSDLAAQEKENFNCNVQYLTEWIKSVQEQASKPKETENDSLPELESIFLEEMPLSGVSLVSLTENERMEAMNVCDKDEQKFPFEYEKSVFLDRERISGGPLYTIHEETPEDQVLSPKYEKYIEELNMHHAAKIDSVKESLASVHAVEIEKLREIIRNLEHQNLSSLQTMQGLKLQLELELVKVQQNLEQKYKCQEMRLDEKVEMLKHMKVELLSFRQILESKHKQIENLKTEIECNSQREKSLIRNLEENLKISNSKITECEDEKVKIECYWQNLIADLVAEHNQDSEILKQNYLTLFQEKQKVFEDERTKSIEELTKTHETEIKAIKESIQKCVMDETQKYKEDFEQTVCALEAKHAVEISTYQKKVESLLEEKCNLLQKSKEQFESIITQNQRSLKDLYYQIQNKITKEKEKICSSKFFDESLENSFVETLDELNQNIQLGIDNFFKQKYCVDVNLMSRLSEEDHDARSVIVPLSQQENEEETQQTCNNNSEQVKVEQVGNEVYPSKSSCESVYDSEKMQYIVMEEINNMKQEFEEQLALYKTENEKLDHELQLVTNKLTLLEECNNKLKSQLQNVETEHKVNTAELDDCTVRESLTGRSLSTTDMHSWRVHAAQTNSRLLHVLSDLVKTFLDIENDINTRLMEFGLIGSHAEALMHHHDDDTGQSVGSREDFTGIGVGESPNLELHEDGPDLTPRAWDLFTSMGAYDVDTEGEDVVIGASRRLRSAVDHVLHLLSLALDKPKDQDFKLLLKRNEDLSHELREESQDRDNLQMDLVNAESLIRKCESEKQKLEDENFHLCEEKDLLSHEVTSLRIKISELDDEKERSYEQKKQLQAQLDLLASRLGDPEKMPSCNDNLSREVPGLIQENSKLSSEKLSIQKSSNKERQNLISRIQQLELSLEELTAQKEDAIEKLRQEIEDLKAQIDSMEKQLQSYKKFINEQALEREQEREESTKEIRKLNNILKEKDKVQMIEKQHAKEAENLEHQLKVKIEEHKAVVSKKEEVERELRQAFDKIHDLHEVIAELEKQLESKIRNEVELKQKLGSVLKSLSVHEKCNEDLKCQLQEYSNAAVNDESMEKLHTLEEQLASKTQELEQMSQSETLLRELRGQIHFLEAKVDQKTRHLESLQLVSIPPSPVLSDDASHSESHDGEFHQVPCEDGWEMSPRSVHWLEIRRLEERICRLIHIEDELIKQNKELNSELKKLRVIEDELSHEKEALQEQSMDQLLQISALKSHIDELRQRVQPSMNSHAVAELERLREALDNEQEKRRCTLRESKDLKEQINEMEVELQEKSRIIQKLCNKPEVQVSSMFTQTDLGSQDKEKHNLDMVQIDQYEQEVKQLKEKLSQAESALVKSKEEMSVLMGQIVILENLSQKSKEELEIEQKQLEKDFDTIQDMMQQKEKELNVLQDEAENQLHLEATAELLGQQLAEHKLIEKELCEKIEVLEKELEESKLSHAHDVEVWQLKIDNMSEKYASEQRALQNQIFILKEGVLNNSSYEDIDLKVVQEKITDAASKLNGCSEDSKDLFKQVVYKILEQAVQLKAKMLEKQHEVQIDNVHKSWREKLEEESIHLKQSAKEQLKREVLNVRKKSREEMQYASNALKQKFNEEMKKLLEEKDKFWQEKMKEMELSLNSDKESIKRLISAESQLKDEVAKKVEEVKKILEDSHQQEVGKLKEAIEKLNREKESSEELLKSLHEKEKAVLVMEFENKFFFITQQLKSKLDQEKHDLQESYQRQTEELQQALNSKLEEEKKKLQLQQQEELNSFHTVLNKHWKEEMVKFHQFHQEELKESKDNMEDILSHLFTVFEHKLKNIQGEYIAKVTEKKSLNFTHQQEQLQKLQKELQEKFDKEKRDFFEAKEKQMRAELKQQYDKKFLEKLESRELENLANNVKVLEESWQTKMESGERILKAAHEKEVAVMKQNFEIQLQSQEAKLLKAHQNNLQELKKQYSRKLNDANEIIKALKAASSKGRLNYIKASSSDVNSSDDACSSSVGDLSPSNQEQLVKKIYSDGVRVLTLSENWLPQRSETNLDLQSLLDERLWIITRLQHIFPSHKSGEHELKFMVDKVVEEILFLRRSMETFIIRNKKLNEQICQLQQKHNSELCEFDQQGNINSHVEAALPAESNNISLPPEFVRNEALYDLSESNNDLELSSIEQLRSEFIRRSANWGVPVLENPDGSPLLLGRSSQSKSGGRFDSPTNDQVKWADSGEDVAQQDSIKFKKKDYIQSSFFSANSCGAKEMKFASTPRQQDELNSRLEAQEEWKTTLVKVVTPKSSPSAASKVHYLYWKYRKSHSHRKALIFQKRYLLSLLSGYQTTEEITLAMLAKMGVNISKCRDLSSSSSACRNSRPKGSRLFRCAAFTIVAVTRMRNLVSHWHKAATVPSAQIIEKEVRSLMKETAFKYPTSNTDCRVHCSNSSVSTPSVDDGLPCRGSRLSNRSSKSNSANHVSNPEHGHLIEYVNRLETLHRQLGLDNHEAS